MTISRLEINIKRLLKSTETLNRDDSTSLNWKLEKDNPAQRVVALQMMSHGVSTPDGNISREIQQKTASKYNLDIRNELFGVSEENKNDIRQRKQDKSTGEDLDSVINYHRNAQEKILDDMLLLTRDLKEQTKLANTIIQRDLETLQKSSGLADNNLTRLKIESKTLEEHNRRAWRCWMWVLIFVVMIIFIFTVLFMKVAKKSS
ncbi:hypothetical protein RUM44_011376 [Polyplax serrata]|uniref:Vesicle transport protein USE1 n=1 Tax=Polyplax serrata TaxID=468196 RepID=A0ABR1APV1_POLSC